LTGTVDNVRKRNKVIPMGIHKQFGEFPLFDSFIHISTGSTAITTKYLLYSTMTGGIP
jgi:hypothetical protein